MDNIVTVLLENILILILCLLMTGCTAIILMKKQASILKITRTDFSSGENKIHFVQISDLHIPLLPVGFKRICYAIADERPEFIVITGDLCAKQSEGRLESFLYMLTNSARCPVYITLGNHDNALFKGDLKYKKAFIANVEGISNYIKVLENDYVMLNIDDRRIIVAGLADFRDDYAYDCLPDSKENFKKKKEIVQSLIKEWNLISKNNNAYLIVASHNPDVMLFIENKVADLFTFGHTHGGQIWLPFNLEFILLRKDKLPHKGYVYGKYEYMNNQIYITCGVGCTVIPLRFRSNPEVCIHTI